MDKCTNISATADTILDISKTQFLSNKVNKQRFVSFLINHLQNIIGNILCVQAPDDADVLIITTALECLQTTDVTIYGDDTDLMALLVHHADTIQASNYNMILQTKVCRWDIKTLLDKIHGTTFKSHILAIHALSGCDTSSRIYGKGKEKFFNIHRDNVEYWNAAELFYKIDVPKEEIIKAGQLIFLTVYRNANQNVIGDLNSLRAACYEGKTYKAASLIKAQTLPPTSDAAALHSLRCYLQVQVWQGNDTLNPLENRVWVWYQEWIYAPNYDECICSSGLSVGQYQLWL